jgi:hypothetical protein
MHAAEQRASQVSRERPHAKERGGPSHFLPSSRRAAPRALPMGSLGYRLSEIERAVPYQDVRPAWAKNSRHSWVVKTFKQAGSASKLAELTLELLDALTPSCIKYLWPEDEDGFSKLRESLLKVSTSKGKDASIKNTLASVRAKKRPSGHVALPRKMRGRAGVLLIRPRIYLARAPGACRLLVPRRDPRRPRFFPAHFPAADFA